MFANRWTRTEKFTTDRQIERATRRRLAEYKKRTQRSAQPAWGNLVWGPQRRGYVRLQDEE